MRKVVLLSIIGVILFNLFFYHAGWGIGFAGIFLSFNIFFYLTRNPKSNNLRYAYIASILSVLFALLFAFRASGVVQLMNVLSSIFFGLVALNFYKQEERFALTIPSFLLSPLLTLKQIVKSMFTLKKDDWNMPAVKKDIVLSLVRGVAIMIPLVIVLFFLLKEADPVFARFSDQFFRSIGDRLIFTIIVFFIFFSFAATKILQIVKKGKALKAVPSAKIYELGTIAGGIILLFTAFIVIQFQYLFPSGGERELHEIGVMSLTYSEYIRKGFVELLIVAAIASSVIMYILQSLHFLQVKPKRALQLLSSILTVETAILLLSDAKRVYLYAEAHGLTRARLFGLIFLVWLALLLVIFIISIIRKQRSLPLFGQVFIISLAALLSISVLNIDGIMATQYKPTVNNEVDYFYLTNLSTDAAQSWKPAVSEMEKTMNQLSAVPSLSEEDMRKLYWTRTTCFQLDGKIGSLIDKYGTIEEYNLWHTRGGEKPVKEFPQSLQTKRTWQAFQISEYQAYTLVKKEISHFKKIISLRNQTDDLWRKESLKQPAYIPLDRSTKAPLTR